MEKHKSKNIYFLSIPDRRRDLWPHNITPTFIQGLEIPSKGFIKTFKNTVFNLFVNV